MASTSVFRTLRQTQSLNHAFRRSAASSSRPGWRQNFIDLHVITQQMDLRPRVGLGVFVYRPDDFRILLGRRKGSIGAGTLSLAGGHLEHNESFSQCAAREVLEETALELDSSSVKFLTTTESFFTQEDKHYVTIFMSACVKRDAKGEIPEPKVMEPEKCEGWEWFAWSQVRRLVEFGGESVFLPIVNLVRQRPEVCEVLEGMERGAKDV